MNTPSKPALFNSDPKKPPEFASFHPPATGDLQTTMYLPPKSVPVPFRGPDTKTRMKGIDSRFHQVVEQPGPLAVGADEVLRHFLRQRPFCYGASGQVHKK
jgi:hypothetical protein